MPASSTGTIEAGPNRKALDEFIEKRPLFEDLFLGGEVVIVLGKLSVVVLQGERPPETPRPSSSTVTFSNKVGVGPLLGGRSFGHFFPLEAPVVTNFCSSFWISGKPMRALKSENVIIRSRNFFVLPSRRKVSSASRMPPAAA